MELPTRKANRLPDYDYSTANAYFITICANDRKNLFWQPVGATTGRPQLSVCGRIILQNIQLIYRHYPAVTVDHYVIMPDHIHLLLQIHADGGRPMTAPTVSRIIKQFKGIVTKQIGRSIWQKGFYDHIIRDENDYFTKRQYIEENIAKLAEQRNWDQFISWDE